MSKTDRTGLSRRKLLGGAGASGLAAIAAGTLTLGVPRAALAAQNDWRWCRKCQGLGFAKYGVGLCHYYNGRSGHEYSDSGNYVLRFRSDGGDGQDNWRWCAQCQLLHFRPNDSRLGNCTVCFACNHSVYMSGYYLIETSTGDDGPGAQDQWYWCRQCEGLWFAEHSTGACPGYAGHTKEGSSNDVLYQV